MNEQAPTNRELEILKILWERERATVREVFETLATDDTPLAYTTVLSLLQTMERKGLVGHEPAGKAYVYFAKVQRERTFRGLARAFLDRVFDGAMDEYLVRAMESRQPSAKELDQIERMIADHKKRLESPEKGDSTP